MASLGVVQCHVAADVSRAQLDAAVEATPVLFFVFALGTRGISGQRLCFFPPQPRVPVLAQLFQMGAVSFGLHIEPFLVLFVSVSLHGAQTIVECVSSS